jgi:hypothetical protein
VGLSRAARGALFVAGCYRIEDTRWTAAQKQTGPAVAKEAVAGSKLNKFFPKAEGEWDVVFRQEKQGVSEAALTKGGKDMATLAIFDTVSDASVADEYKEAKDKLDAHPMLAKGNLGTAILVADRYQVTVRTVVGAWLQRGGPQGLDQEVRSRRPATLQ